MLSQKEFIENIKPKLPIRSRYFCRLFYCLALFKKLSIVNSRSKENKDFVLLTICNKKTFRMVKAMLYSFLKNSEMRPNKIVIVSDGTWNESAGRKYFSGLESEIVFDTWDSCAQYCRDNGLNDIYIWAKKQIWGKKMAAIVKYAHNNLVLFSDPDVLWYGCPITKTDLDADNVLKLSIDNSHNYDDELIKKMHLEYLYDYTPINCGVVLFKGDLLSRSPLALASISKEAEIPGNFSEQTVLAILNHDFGTTWSTEEISATIRDIISPIMTTSSYPDKLIARHYLWKLKWLYWRDLITTIK